MRRNPFNFLISMVPDYLEKTIKIPEIQRESNIWTLEQKQNLIDSLYNDFDIPKIYLRIKTDEPTIWRLIDGQQRLTTVDEFIKNKFHIGDSSTMPEELHGKKYKALPPEAMEKIIGRSFDAVKVECTDDEEEDMFTRLNNGTPLSAAEKRNAMSGQIRDSVKNLAKHKFFKNKINFGTRRYACDAVCAQLTALYLAGQPTDTKGKSLKKLYEEKRKYPERKQAETEIKKILNRMDKIFQNKEPYMKKYNVLSIFFFLLELTQYATSNIKDTRFYKFFNDFETSRYRNSQISEDNENFDHDLNRYQISCVNSPDSQDAIKTRHEVLLKKFLLEFRNVENKDSNRIFTKEQKEAIYYINKKRCKSVSGFSCPNRNRDLPFDDCEFDHIKEHSMGGKTTVQNGQVLCHDCHSFKTKKYRSVI